ncbi:hypothetical protein [Ellagibacter isourolithinifaciens]|uniref:hypothetical protein n=1 Tax=Ellagibacter isourolithinifaciens TaxID=2137581 RepID=UPI003A91F79B
MIPHMKLHERLLAWLLMRIEAKHGWGGGFSDDNEGMRWLLEGDRAQLSWCIELMRDYMHVINAREWDKEDAE